MNQRRNPAPPKAPSKAPAKRMVWRISEAAPLGEFVDPDMVPPTAPQGRPEVSTGGWIVSSFELLHGTEVSESPDTVPDDLFDELFPPHKDPFKSKGRG